MSDNYVLDKNFEKIESLPKGEYESCTFIGCDFSEQDFSGFKFSECIFKNCNLSLVKLNKTSLTEVEFKGC